jgi:hypothetical protein
VKKALRLTDKPTKRIKLKPHASSTKSPDTQKMVKTAMGILDKRRKQRAKGG